MTNRGMAIYFHDERIRIFNKTIEDLGCPKYIHLFINEENGQLFIRRAEKRDNDTFRVTITKHRDSSRYRINSKSFVKYLAHVIGVAFPSDSLWFEGRLLDDGMTVLINLRDFHISEYRYDD